MTALKGHNKCREKTSSMREMFSFLFAVRRCIQSDVRKVFRQGRPYSILRESSTVSPAVAKLDGLVERTLLKSRCVQHHGTIHQGEIDGSPL